MTDNQMLLECMNEFNIFGFIAICITIASVTYTVRSFKGAIKAYTEEHNIEN